MKKYKRRNSIYPLTRIIKILVCIAIPVIIINIVVTLLSVIIIKQQNIDSITNTVNLYQTETSTKVHSVEHFIQWSVVHEPLLEKLEETSTYGEMPDIINDFRTRVSDSQYSTGLNYQYFLNLDKQSMFFNCSHLLISYSDYLTAKNYFTNLIQSGGDIKNNCQWNTIKLSDTYYFYYLITYHNYTFITLISSDALLEPLKDINLGTDGFIAMEDSHGNIIAEQDKINNTNKFNNTKLLHNYIKFDKKDSSLPFTLYVYVDSFGNFEKILIIQVIVIITALMVALTLTLFVFYLHKKVIKPIQNFSKNLSTINDSVPPMNVRDTNILELEQANEQFKNLMHEIKRLKINIYEQELEKKRIHIDFMQLQIKPHFYLNCLTTIHSLAKIEKYDEIEAMVLFTSKYLRYLFQTNKDFVPFEAELNHINAYLDIQALRYGQVFSYTCQVDEMVKNALIPPLILMTFIENSIKHSMSLENNLKISISAHIKKKNEEDYVHIFITDTGTGFPEDILNKLNNHELLLNKTTGAHLGINNTIQRLSLLFENNYELHFSNGESEIGAQIEILFKYMPKKGDLT